MVAGDAPLEAGSRSAPGAGRRGVIAEGGKTSCIGGAMITAPGDVGELGAIGEVIGVVGALDCAAHNPVNNVNEHIATVE